MFVLDVGPRMHPHLAQAARATADFITEKASGAPRLRHPQNRRFGRPSCCALHRGSPAPRHSPACTQIVHKAKHQVCLLLFGASETRNRENDKSALEEGGEAEYSHIVEAHGYAADVRMAAACMLCGIFCVFCSWTARPAIDCPNRMKELASCALPPCSLGPPDGDYIRTLHTREMERGVGLALG